ncbi:MAG: D-glycero-alpha-D-manno-heptose-1,7-bisphosphate 7-phosphatase [Promethearchaeota archaeon]
MTRAIFLDRDGTLIADPGYAYRPEQFELLPGVVEGLRLLQEHYTIFVVTNQSGIGRGYYTEEQFWAFNAILVRALAEKGVQVQRTYFCPHVGGCACKKPSPHFIIEAAAEFPGLDLPGSWTVGDHPSDVQFGTNAGCRGIYVLTGHGRKHLDELDDLPVPPAFIANNFLEAARFIHENTPAH